ncbi:SDR family oxidoreductase [Streptomyces bambusae]|uniref:SDR family oxidoreductase n=1 Tax=Streptomyces bambusae TaxID=1550616 RepID=UPI001CFF721D|nr:SDR family oxidoreductase [Streptomyces bambusae]MCB5170218.1 SDR family oxidoreductase [Streptomyces bambusae]
MRTQPETHPEPQQQPADDPWPGTGPVPPGTLRGKVALVAGATRGAGRAIAEQLGAAGATVYVTGRTSRTRASEVGRTTETIEQTAELVTAAGGEGIAVVADHLDRAQVAGVVERIDAGHGRLDVLVNDLWGGEHLVVFGKRIWETDLDQGLRMLELGVKSHIITSWHALPLLVRNPGGLVVEITDGTAETNERFRENFFYDLAKNGPIRMARTLAHDLGGTGCHAVSVTPGWLRSEQMLEAFGVTEATWRDAAAKVPGFGVSESPRYVARAVAALAADPDVARWNGQSLASGQLARAYGFTDTDGSRPDAWGYIQDVEIGGADRSPDDYR